jgi:xanthosine utilization system XapX-like protein
MHLTDVARTVIAYVTSAAIVGLPVVVVGIVYRRLTRRRAPRLVAVAVVMLGLLLGYALLASETAPAVRATAILGIAALVAVTSRVGRLTLAGLVLITAGSPWTAYAGARLVDALAAGRRIDPAVLLPPVGGGFAVIVVGISLIRFHRRYLARHPEAVAPPSVETTARVWGAAGKAALGPSVLGLNAATAASTVALFIGTLVTASAGHGQPILPALAAIAIGSIATGLAAAVAWAVVWPPRSRRAFEAFAWLGEWGLERFRELTSGRVAPTVGNMKRYVRNNAERPEDRWIRVEVLAATGKIDAAREMAARIPDDTPIGRVERLDYVTYIDWLGGGEGDPADLRAAVDAIEPVDGDDHLRADVALALSQVRRLIAAGDADPAAPLRDVRDRLGARADRVMVAAARRLTPGFLKLSTSFVVAITLLDRAFTV